MTIGVAVLNLRALTGLSALCAILGVLAYFSAPALAVAPEKPVTKEATAVIATTATLHGELNPGTEGEPGEYEFLYKAAPATECGGGQTAPVPAGIALGDEKELVSARLSGLLPATKYTFCLLARNAEGETKIGESMTFTTDAQAPPKIEEESVIDVVSSSANVNATIDPEGAETSYRFEYGTGTGYALVPKGEGKIAEGVGNVSVSADLEGLAPDTTYNYRVVAASVLGGALGLGETFTTQMTGGEFALPDGREWELVSPPDKHGVRINPISKGGGAIQSAEDGGAFTYVAGGPLTNDASGNRAPEFAQFYATRGSGGWVSEDITTPHDAVALLVPGRNSEDALFSGDLSTALVEPAGETPLPPLKEGAEKTIYLRHNGECKSTPAEAIPVTCYQALVTEANVPEGKHFGEGASNNLLHFVGSSSDLQHVIIESEEALSGNIATTNGQWTLYEWSAGGSATEQLKLVSVLPPNGKGEEIPAAESEGGKAAALGSRGLQVRNAVSNNGSRVVWEAAGHLYLRDTQRGETVQIDVPQEGVNEESVAPHAVFQDASSDGSKIFFTDYVRLTSDSKAEDNSGESRPDLYVFEVASKHGRMSGTLTDLTNDANQQESADVQGDVLGLSEDGDTVFFVADGVLSGTDATSGTCRGALEPGALCNLYEDHFSGAGWEVPQLVARLSNSDESDWAGQSPENLGYLSSRVSRNGQFLAFMSDRELTGYNNEDVSSTAPGERLDEEVYLFDSAKDRITCASCNPTGARPEGILDPSTFGATRLLVDEPETWSGSWLAGNLPGWTEVNLGSALYQPRYLSNTGRLFFDSADSLVPADINGIEDVYGYEPEGEQSEGGRCDNSTQSASEIFKMEGEKGNESDGCLALISSGTSSQESAFLDASSSGDDVFFMTTSQLVPQDIDGAYDVYDAHVCSASALCPVSVGNMPPACSTADSCRAAPTPQPGVFGAPSTAMLSSGGGNAVQPAPRPADALKKSTRSQKLGAALRACRKQGHRRRAVCERQARKRYGPVKSGKSTKKLGGSK
ncbi:MAG TPA: fibronectin type III domain-containing protein [Solirubrobacteraceae bacterium]|nr:fibronectin type III domain-containing protein [Solirubrobacteraceae bacterium]